MKNFSIVENMKFLSASNNRKVVYIMQGVSGSGKSTATKKLISFNDQHTMTKIVSADHFWETAKSDYDWDPKLISNAHQWCYGNFIMAVRKEIDCIIVDNTNTCEDEYRRYVDFAVANGYNVYLVPVHGELTKEDLVECHKRNTHGVPLFAIEAQYSRMFPNLKEG